MSTVAPSPHDTIVIAPIPPSQQVATTQEPSQQPAKTSSGWLFHPVIDGLFVACLLWPLMALATAALVGNPYGEKLGFLVAYFLIMPHRWITLSLVFLDPVKFKQNAQPFLLVAAAIIAGVFFTRMSMGALTLLLAVDFVWNAWHFAAQHGGIARIYERMAHPNNGSTGMADKIVLRSLVLFAIFRMASDSMPAVDAGAEWLAWVPVVMKPLAMLDFAILALPLWLISRELLQLGSSGAKAAGRITYLLSITALYGLMIMGVRYGHAGLAIGCAAGATFFHSVEYLAIVTWYVKKNKSLHETKPFCYFVPRWAVALVTFMAACFLGAFMFKHRYLHAWVLLNVIVSFMHYAYDGMIWKRPKKKAA